MAPGSPFVLLPIVQPRTCDFENDFKLVQTWWGIITGPELVQDVVDQFFSFRPRQSA
jgi:hypothetical protein